MKHFRAGFQEVLVKRASLHDAAAGFGRDPKSVSGFENVRVEGLVQDIGLHGLD